MLSKFKCMVQVGIKVENCLTSFRPFKAHSTLSSSEPINESALREGFTNVEAELLVKTIKALEASIGDIAADSLAPKSDIEETKQLSDEYVCELKKYQDDLLSSMRSDFAKFDKDMQQKIHALRDEVGDLRHDMESQCLKDLRATELSLLKFSLVVLMSASTVGYAAYSLLM